VFEAHAAAELLEKGLLECASGFGEIQVLARGDANHRVAL